MSDSSENINNNLDIPLTGNNDTLNNDLSDIDSDDELPCLDELTNTDNSNNSSISGQSVHLSDSEDLNSSDYTDDIGNISMDVNIQSDTSNDLNQSVSSTEDSFINSITGNDNSDSNSSANSDTNEENYDSNANDTTQENHVNNIDEENKDNDTNDTNDDNDTNDYSDETKADNSIPTAGTPITPQVLSTQSISISNTLDDIDKELINSLVTPDYKITSNKIMLNNIQNIILPKTNLKSHIDSLIILYNSIKNDPIYVSTKYHLASKVVSIFKIVPIQRYFEKNFLNDEFVDYLIKKHLFYDYVLSTLLIRDWNLDYFNFEPSKNHVTFYKVCCTKLYQRLNLFLQNSQYYIYRASDFTTYISFIKLLIPYISILNNEDRISLFSSFSKLFLTIVNQLYSIIHTSKNTLETLDLISEDYLKYYINKSGGNNIKRLESEITKCSNNINRFYLNTIFIESFCEYIKDFDICKHHTHVNYSEISSLLPSLSHSWNEPNNDLYKLLDNIYINRLEDIFKNNDVNIHSKVKILSESDNHIFNSENVIILLIDLFSNIEKYDENSGFYDKDLVRYYIVKAILEFVKPTVKNVSPLNLTTSYVKDEFDNISNKLDIFSKIDTHKLCSFVTLLISEMTDLFNSVELSHKQLSNKKDVSYIYKYVNGLDNIILYYKLINYLISYRKLSNPFSINKYCELFNVIITNSFKNRIYCQLEEFTESNYNDIPILNNKFIKSLYEFYQLFYKNLFNIINNVDFIEAFIDNEALYDRKCLVDTKTLIGFLHHQELNLSFEQILDRFMSIIDKQLFNKHQTLDKYDEEIPSEFVDPIYYIPIVNPMEMPNTKTIVEKKIIINHLVFNQTNPFDGLPLTREEFLAYNNNEEVKTRIELFKNQFHQWKLEHKI